jgi:NAD(P)-dependent dehydrogenase (short-subunit alcohol dehydrogenase family)
MTTFEGCTAIVTGAASGIGLALSQALVGRGCHVWLTDVDAAAAKTAAEGIGSRAVPAELDVRDARAIAQLVEHVATDRGGLDFMFNNAGIGVGGEMHQLSVEHYDRIVDINIRGVMNGIAAAYPLMVEQRHGHIVNTASAGGLLPMPLLTPYSMTKHAVVGLSESLRLEAESYGVRVSALCPSAIDTPLLDTEGPTDLPSVWRPDLRRYLTKMAGPPYPSDAFAEYALDSIAANQGLIVAPRSARISALLNRIAPGLVRSRIRAALQAERKDRPTS